MQSWKYPRLCQAVALLLALSLLTGGWLWSGAGKSAAILPPLKALDNPSPRLTWTSAQCRSAFSPLLFKENAIAHPQTGLARPDASIGKIVNNRLYVRQYVRNPHHKNTRGLALFNFIHDAVVTSPEPIPDIEFSFGIEDGPDVDLWALSRNVADPAKPDPNPNWLMPDFGFYSWPEPLIGAFDEVQEKAGRVNREVPWDQKEDKLLFRGALKQNRNRELLLQVTMDKPWADVADLDWMSPSARLDQWDHCRYRYLAHAEGNTYSGRLKYLLLCDSVVIMHRLSWMQHFHHLFIEDGPGQNVVVVDKDWTGLEEAVTELQANQSKTRMIVENARNLRSYLSDAATYCYWRDMFHAYAKTTPRATLDELDVPFKSFTLMRATKWDIQ